MEENKSAGGEIQVKDSKVRQRGEWQLSGAGGSGPSTSTERELYISQGLCRATPWPL